MVNNIYDTLVISGASSSGIILLGKLAQLQIEKEFDLSSISTFAGTSIGAVICLLLCIGYSPAQIACNLRHSNVWCELLNLDITRIYEMKGVFSLKLLENELKKLIVVKMNRLPSIGELNCNFICAAFNLTCNKIVYFNNIDTPQMDAVTAVILSCAIPFLFEPQIYDNCTFIDGGILDNFPLAITCKKFNCHTIMGLVCNKNYTKEDNHNVWEFRDFIKVLFASSSFYTSKQIEEISEEKLVTIVTVNSNIPFYDLNINMDKIDMMFQYGCKN